MPDIHHSIQIAAPLADVMALVATADGLRQWWAEDVEEAGGITSLGFFNRTTVYRLRRLELTAARCVWRCESGQEWEGTDLIIGLSGGGGAVVLDFRHANWREETPYFVSCNTTWGGLMFRLRAAAEKHGAGPLFARNGLGY